MSGEEMWVKDLFYGQIVYKSDVRLRVGQRVRGLVRYSRRRVHADAGAGAGEGERLNPTCIVHRTVSAEDDDDDNVEGLKGRGGSRTRTSHPHPPPSPIDPTRSQPHIVLHFTYANFSARSGTSGSEAPNIERHYSVYCTRHGRPATPY